MVTQSFIKEWQDRAAKMVADAGIVLTQDEIDGMEIAEFGLGQFERIGLAIVVYINTERYCAKELIMPPRQSCPEHRHPTVDGQPGKMETFRCRWGKVWLYFEGEPAENPACKAPEGSEECFTVWHEVALNPGEQCTIPPNTLHWFQAGDEGAIVSEFSSTSRDECDVFTDVRLQRIVDVEE